MNQHQFTGETERLLRRYEYDDRWVVAADLSAVNGDVDVDVVGTTAIVVVTHDDETAEFEFELPGEAATVETTNDVLTITIHK